MQHLRAGRVLAELTEALFLVQKASCCDVTSTIGLSFALK